MFPQHKDKSYIVQQEKDGVWRCVMGVMGGQHDKRIKTIGTRVYHYKYGQLVDIFEYKFPNSGTEPLHKRKEKSK